MMVSDRLVNLAHVTRNKERKDTLLDRGFIDALAFALIELGNEDYEKLLAMYKPSIQFELEQLGFNHIFILISSYSKDLIITRLNKRDKVLTTKQKERSLNNIERFDDAYRTVMFHLGLVNDYIEINANNSPETIADEIEKILAQKDCSSD
jgi:deoxyadenosine/deoxycytidine kinase